MSCSSKVWAPVSYWVNQNLISLLLQYNALGNCFQLAQSKSRTEFKYLCFYLMVIQWCTFFFCTFFILYCTSSMAVRHVKPLVLCMHGSYKAVLQYSRWKQNYHLLLLDKITTQQLSKANRELWTVCVQSMDLLIIIIIISSSRSSSSRH